MWSWYKSPGLLVLNLGRFLPSVRHGELYRTPHQTSRLVSSLCWGPSLKRTLFWALQSTSNQTSRITAITLLLRREAGCFRGPNPERSFPIVLKVLKGALGNFPHFIEIAESPLSPPCVGNFCPRKAVSLVSEPHVTAAAQSLAFFI